MVHRWAPSKTLPPLTSPYFRRAPGKKDGEPQGALTVTEGAPLVAIVEDDHQDVTKTALPGVKQEAIQVGGPADALPFSGARKDETEAKDNTFHRGNKPMAGLPEGLPFPRISTTKRSRPTIDPVTPKHREGNAGPSVTRLSSPATVGDRRGRLPPRCRPLLMEAADCPLRGGTHPMGPPSSWAPRSRCLGDAGESNATHPEGRSRPAHRRQSPLRVKTLPDPTAPSATGPVRPKTCRALPIPRLEMARHQSRP